MAFNNDGVLTSITEKDVNGTTYFHMVLASVAPPSGMDAIVITFFIIAGAGAIVLIVVYYFIKRNKLSVREAIDEEPFKVRREDVQ